MKKINRYIIGFDSIYYKVCEICFSPQNFLQDRGLNLLGSIEYFNNQFEWFDYV